MLSSRVCRVLAVVMTMGLLSACANSDELKQRISGRWGPNPAIQPAEVDTAIRGQVQVLSYLARESGIVINDGVDGYYSIRPHDWYRVAEWGFNVGRQDCEIYLDNLFRMSREKQRNDSMLSALGTAAAAIVTGTTTHAQVPLSVLAAAFGLTTALNDALFQSYLFTESPGLIANKVKELQDSYRDSVKKNSAQIATPEAAYNVIQNYYHICLPQTIDGTLLQTVSDTTAKTSNAGTSPKIASPTATSVNTTPKLVKQ